MLSARYKQLQFKILDSSTPITIESIGSRYPLPTTNAIGIVCLQETSDLITKSGRVLTCR